MERKRGLLHYFSYFPSFAFIFLKPGVHFFLGHLLFLLFPLFFFLLFPPYSTYDDFFFFILLFNNFINNPIYISSFFLIFFYMYIFVILFLYPFFIFCFFQFLLTWFFFLNTMTLLNVGNQNSPQIHSVSHLWIAITSCERQCVVSVAFSEIFSPSLTHA